MRRILDKLGEIESTSPNCAAFVEHVRTIVNAFDLKRYTTTLEAVRNTQSSDTQVGGGHA